MNVVKVAGLVDMENNGIYRGYGWDMIAILEVSLGLWRKDENRP